MQSNCDTDRDTEGTFSIDSQLNCTIDEESIFYKLKKAKVVV